MQKQSIYHTDSVATRRTIANGCRTLSKWQRWGWSIAVAIGVLCCLLGFWREQTIWWLFAVLAVLNAGLWWLQYRDPKPQFLTTPFADLQARDGKVWIGQQALPDNLRKLVLGTASAQGPAFLQLPWNQGDQWLFIIEELPQLRQFLQQHLPHVQIIED